MNIKLFLLCTLFNGASAIAHEGHDHNNIKLTDFPNYESLKGKANGKLSKLAAVEFIRLLDDKKKLCVLDFDSPERKKWSNLPRAYAKRPGLNLGQLSEAQREKLFRFLASSLSQQGYHLVEEVIAGESILHKDPSAKRHQWNPENYFICFFGDPAKEATWAWHFGGHHLALNITIRNEQLYSMSPSFIGNSPVKFTHQGKKYGFVNKMHEAGDAIFNSLNEQQKQDATLKKAPKQVATGPKDNGVIPELVGLKIAELKPDQRAFVMEAVKLWLNTQAAENATRRLVEIEKDLPNAYFAWSGKLGLGEHCYYRIQSPSFIIEFRSMPAVGGSTASGMGHVHTMYRDFRRDYGAIE